PQYAHLRASMLAYAHINLLAILRRFEPGEVVRVATDSLYVQKAALRRLDGVGAYAAPRSPAAPAQWRDKGEQLYMPLWHAAYAPDPEYVASIKNVPGSTAPPIPTP
ncbi:MAG: hypothetical protein AB2556_25970, partial [Candidatus Thiodiazotropha sp.]